MCSPETGVPPRPLVCRTVRSRSEPRSSPVIGSLPTSLSRACRGLGGGVGEAKVLLHATNHSHVPVIYAVNHRAQRLVHGSIGNLPFGSVQNLSHFRFWLSGILTGRNPLETCPILRAQSRTNSHTTGLQFEGLADLDLDPCRRLLPDDTVRSNTASPHCTSTRGYATSDFGSVRHATLMRDPPI